MAWIEVLITFVASTTFIGTLAYVRKAILGTSKSQRGILVVSSPRTTLLPHLSNFQIAALPYPPDLFPGARDVATPYGSMRVYEWGPEDGRKVLMIPGDTTPAPVFGHIAKVLVPKGFRIMILDTWGRGYSDSPQNVDYDVNLFAMQAFFAIASSPLSWTGVSSGGFSIIGFSLGGAVTMSLAARFPYLINSIILLAPGGLIRQLPEGYVSLQFRYRSWLPTSYLRRLASLVLGTQLHESSLLSETAEPVSMENLNLPALWQWQFDYHEGFVHSFIDTTQNGPLSNMHEDWKIACSYISGQRRQEPNSPVPCRLSGTKLLVICGADDTVVVGEQLLEELSCMLPKENLDFRTISGTHSFPVFNGEGLAKEIMQFWGLD